MLHTTYLAIVRLERIAPWVLWANQAQILDHNMIPSRFLRAEYFFLFLVVFHNKQRSLPFIVREIERTTVLVVHWDSTATRVKSGTFFPVRICDAPLLQVICYVIRVRSVDSFRKSIARVTATALPTDMIKRGVGIQVKIFTAFSAFVMI